MNTELQDESFVCTVLCKFQKFFYWHFHSGSDLLTLSHTGVSIKIEVACRFESSNWQYQQGGVSPLLLGGEEGVWVHSAPENFDISKP